jgi:hypothetical protein
MPRLSKMLFAICLVLVSFQMLGCGGGSSSSNLTISGSVQTTGTVGTSYSATLMLGERSRKRVIAKVRRQQVLCIGVHGRKSVSLFLLVPVMLQAHLLGQSLFVVDFPGRQTIKTRTLDHNFLSARGNTEKIACIKTGTLFRLKSPTLAKNCSPLWSSIHPRLAHTRTV